MKNTTTSLVIKIFVVVFGVAIIVWGLDALRTNTSSWLSVPAKILAPVSAKDGIYYSGMYEYQVGNTRYSDSFNGTDKYEPGQEITVYYDPSSPGSTITSRGEMTFNGIVGILFGLFCVGGVAWDTIKPMVAKR
ncbi:MAG: DUF3592 domain-containing protein [Chloroflexi bacterium]|nr:DUF3592 domain-containing protein [Chloroflexota bacterium]